MFAFLWALAFSAPWIVAADRNALNVQDAMPTGFASCTCEKEVLENKSPKTKEVILVTKKWSLDQCISTCPGYCTQDGAPFVRCLEVRTATGTTGNKKSEHFSMIPNMVPDRKWGNEPLNMMVRQESYLPANGYSACSCKMSDTNHTFLYGHEGFMGGLQVWGRVGCDRSCTQECFNLGSDSTGCILSEMTKSYKGKVGEVGYQREPLVVNNGKRPTQEGIQAHKVQQQPQVTESEIKVDIPVNLMKDVAS